jgi:hypothetical protein
LAIGPGALTYRAGFAQKGNSAQKLLNLHKKGSTGCEQHQSAGTPPARPASHLAPARWRGSGRLQKRSVEHASRRRGPTNRSAILSEFARCYCLHTARAQAACQGVDRQRSKPLACTARWRKSANRMVKGPSPERRATARLRRKRASRDTDRMRPAHPVRLFSPASANHTVGI